jgi:deoxycytidylate deaminase
MDSFANIKNLLETLARTREDEVDCGKVFDHLDVYAELVAHGEDPGELLPLVKQHLEICHCCHQELEALVQILERDLE